MANQHSILFVDDDGNVVDALRRRFHSVKEWKMSFAMDADQALAILHSRHVDLVVTDVMMPGTSGIGLLRSIRAKFPGVAVIMITGLPSVDAAIECIKEGAIDYISKPIAYDELKETITAGLRKRDEGLEKTQPMGNGASVHQRQVGEYRIVGLIGEGSMGSVFKVTKGGQENDLYALKMMKASFLLEEDRQQLVSRFLREAETVCSLDHPNIASVYDFGIDGKDRIPYIIMELIQGNSVRRMISGKMEFSMADRIRVIRQVASALALVHDKNLLHRDIKPGNILVTLEGDAKLIDFGIVKIPHSELTNPGTVMGTPAYIAPETIEHDGESDQRSDLYALGVVAYEFLTGTKPFEAENIIKLAREIMFEDPLPLHEMNPQVDEMTERIVLRLLEKKPGDRYQSAGELLIALDLALADQSMKV